MAENENKRNKKIEYNSGVAGLNMDNVPSQIDKGRLTYALNAAIENFNDNSVNYQNELGNELCLDFPENFVLIGHHYINEQSKHIFFITNPKSGDSQIGYMENNDCQYHILVDAPCLNFNVNHPIHKVVHRISNNSTEIYWTDGYNPRRYLDIENIPLIIRRGTPVCDPVYTSEVDCNQLNIQPNFNIPIVAVTDVTNTGDVTAGTYQFTVQYSDVLGNPFTSYYSVTNPTPIADTSITTSNFDYPVGKSIVVDVTNLETTGLYDHFNLAVIKTVNNVSSVELVGTYSIENDSKQITYTGQNVTNIRLSLNDIFEKYPYYEIAQDLTTAQDILIWDNLTAIDRVNYQQIANKVKLEWETWRIPATEDYSDETNATNFKSYLRDEVYPFEIQFLLNNGKETDGFHIPGRELAFEETSYPDVAETDDDFIGTSTYYSDKGEGYSPYWKIYNTATIEGTHPDYDDSDPSYKGPYQYGKFAYWESTEEYPCNEDVWGDLAGEKIRHHKFPDVLVSPIFESKVFTGRNSMVMGNDAIFPIGVKVNTNQIESLIQASNLTPEQKSEIIGFRILRGNRNTNKSVIAKGILRNLNKYERDDREYYFPNYPYNDLNADPFINSTNNAYKDECEQFDIDITTLIYDPNEGKDIAEVTYTDCNTNKENKEIYTEIGKHLLCSINKPSVTKGEGTVSYINYDKYRIAYAPETGNMACGGWKVRYNDITDGIVERDVSAGVLGVGADDFSVNVVRGTKPECIENCYRGALCGNVFFIKFEGSYVEPSNCITPESLPEVENSRRQVFNSPETSFGKPFLGDILKLENVMFGKGKAHFTEVRDNAKYRLISKEAQKEALDSSAKIASITTDFNIQAMFAAYQAYLTIYLDGITRKNYAYSFNSIANYDYSKSIPNSEGVKQRKLDIARYLIPSVTSVSGDVDINNWQRESSVYLKTDEDKSQLPFPHLSPEMLTGDKSILKENSRFTISEAGNCNNPGTDEDIEVVSYYASLKKDFINQWGQIYSYETISTGFEHIFRESGRKTIFGGDTYINRFTFKTKLPFFIDNRVGANDDSDIFYDEIGNIGYPKYWHSARSILSNYVVPNINDYWEDTVTLANFISYKAHNFDCANNTYTSSNIESKYTTTTTTSTTIDYYVAGDGKITTDNLQKSYYDGYFYLFAYGIPNFYCESSYNVDLRQAFNNKEGDFWPHVSSSIPDDWVQEKHVSIANDNTYYYNASYSKQNKENYFSHLPVDWEKDFSFTHYPFRAVYSDIQSTDSDNRVNNWRVYRATSYFDFPQNYGDLTSLDGIQNRAILARFENKTLLYNNLLTLDTSNPQAAYMGNPELFRGAPPIDFADTDLGYVGSQHKMLLKVPQGQITIDAKRGNIFLIQGTKTTELSGFGSGMNRFFTDHLPFKILKYFPNIEIDNHFNGIGLHAVYDNKFERVIITKLDYEPLSDNIKYDNTSQGFYVETTYDEIYKNKENIEVTDSDYFRNKSWTVSFNFNTKSWVSFHSYLPNFYIAENNFFYSGLNDCCGTFDFIAAEIPSLLDCTLYGYAVLSGCDPDCELDGECEEVTTTTTTSSTSTTSTTTIDPSITTTTTTTIGLCELDGEAEEVCTTTTSTTTLDPNITTTTTTTVLCDIDLIVVDPVCIDAELIGYTCEGVTTTTSTTVEPTTTTTTTIEDITTTTTSTTAVPTTTTTTTIEPTTTTSTTETPTTTTTTTTIGGIGEMTIGSTFIIG